MEDLDFENSCKTIISKKSSVFISAFPGKLVFGEVNCKGFIKSKYFQLLHFELFYLYSNFLNIIKFLVREEDNEDKGLILSKDDVAYYWCGKKVVENNKPKKVIIFIQEYKFETNFELFFDEEQFNDFIKCISETILACLCLKPIEKAFFEFITKENTTVIVSLKNQKKCKTILEKFKKSTNLKISSILEPNLIDLVNYYIEILIIAQKLKTMFNSECSNEDLRISALLE